MVPNQFGPHVKMVPRIFLSSRGTGCGDPEISGSNWLGTICPGGPFVQEDQILGDHLSMGTEFDGDHLSREINLMGIVCPGGQEVQVPKNRVKGGVPVARPPCITK